MADPRYKNGIKKLAPAQAESPGLYGWRWGYWNTKYNLPVYYLDPFKMMKHPHQPGWIVDNGQEQWHYTGHLASITADVRLMRSVPMPDEAGIKSKLAALKAQFEPKPPPTIPDNTTPLPFPETPISPTTLKKTSKLLTEIDKKNQAGDQALKTALKNTQPVQPAYMRRFR